MDLVHEVTLLPDCIYKEKRKLSSKTENFENLCAMRI